MKLLFISLSILFLLCFHSCSKDDITLPADRFVKSYPSQRDLYINNTFQLDDGNYVIASNDYNQTGPGQLLKIDANGKLIWEKELSPLIKVLWSTFPVTGKGFVTFGIHDYTSRAMYICLYDIDGNLLSTDSVVTGLSNYSKLPYNMMRLSNGNFAMAGGTLNRSYGMRILDPEFNVIYSTSYISPPDKPVVYCKAMCELSDGSIAVTAIATQSNTELKTLFVFKTDLNGNLISSNLLSDTVYSETANALLPYNDDIIAVTAKMLGFNFGDQLSNTNDNGVIVNYNNTLNYFGGIVSGKINLVQINNEGNITNRTEIKGYPNNGMINSIKKTTDGGYILCGTVNQLSTFLLISDTKIYLLKTDANLNTKWSKIIPTTYPALGIDASQTSDGGYLVTGVNKSFNKRTRVIVFRTDIDGNY